MAGKNYMGKIKRQLPARPRFRFDRYLLIPVLDSSGFVVHGMWHVPGCRVMSSDQLFRLAGKRNVQARILTY